LQYRRAALSEIFEGVNFLKYLHTLRYLKPCQVYGRVSRFIPLSGFPLDARAEGGRRQDIR